MTQPPKKRGFAARPDAESWIKSPEAPALIPSAGYTARLTIDITPELRGRIKIAAFRKGVTVAEMLRNLLSREYPEKEEDDHED